MASEMRLIWSEPGCQIAQISGFQTNDGQVLSYWTMLPRFSQCAQQALLLHTTRGCQKHRRLNLIDPSRSLTTGWPGHLSGLAGRHSRWLKGGLVGSSSFS